jgi:F0F1-type ATP synthase membrane subunit c/vacuolar-type H+-ATPase subunit K
MGVEVDIRKEYRLTSIICGAIASSLLIYALVVELSRIKQVSLASVDPQMLEYIRLTLVVISFSLYLVITYLSGLILKRTQQDNWRTLVTKLRAANIISLALSEMPAVFGLVLFFLSGVPRDFYILLILSAALIYIFFPRFSAWENWLRTSI